MLINLDGKSPEANKANGLARELVTARWAAMKEKDIAIFQTTCNKILEEIEEEADHIATAYLVWALSSYGVVIALAGANATHSEIPSDDVWHKMVDDVLEMCANAFGRGFPNSGEWL